MSKREEKEIVKVLKWAGILALLAVPVYMVFKKKNGRTKDDVSEDESNIFASELEE
jgi:hypothetical protein